MPTAQTIFNWIAKHQEFFEQYARACNIDADIEFESLIELADRATHQNVQVYKLRIDTRKWVLSKRQPKKYGDRQEVEHSGNIQINVEKDGFSKL